MAEALPTAGDARPAGPGRGPGLSPAAPPGWPRLALDVIRMLPANVGFWLARPWRRLALGAAPQRFDEFVGINVTAGPDESYDDYVADRVAELGVRRARIDLADTEHAPHAVRLAKRLAAAGVAVAAHMVQSPALGAATSGPELEPWRDFCRAMAEELGGSIEAMEAGSAPNRHRWSAHTLAGYLATAEPVFLAAREAGIEAWGPNVSDFEPYYSVGMLAAMSRRGLVPGRHTVNLFVDRAGSPEAVDAHAWPARSDLVEKARILAAAGSRYGCRSTVSTYAYWTLQPPGRNRRRYVDEETYARYAVRYLAVTACCSYLGRAYWGQMVGHAKGIIDDGSGIRPRLPAAHHSIILRGELAEYRKRPGFEAIARMVGRLAQARPDGMIRERHAVICSFRSEAERWALAWSPLGESPAPEGLLDEASAVEDIFGAEVDRDSATRLTAAPLYFRLPPGERGGRGGS